jgi:hypothetical protein
MRAVPNAIIGMFVHPGFAGSMPVFASLAAGRIGACCVCIASTAGPAQKRAEVETHSNQANSRQRSRTRGELEPRRDRAR